MAYVTGKLPNKRLWPALLSSLCLLGQLPVSAADINDELAQQTTPNILNGRWSGSITGSFRNQEINWQLELNKAGQMEGFIGPGAAGMPLVPMQDLRIENQHISFSIPAQHASFSGTLSGEEIRGEWQQGTISPVLMHKKTFAFSLPQAAHENLTGQWTLLDDDSWITVSFVENADGRLSGSVDIPMSGLYRVPIVDLFIAEGGLSNFKTDNGRSFSGKLTRGVWIGHYRSPDYQQNLTFIRADIKGQDLALNLSDSAKQLLRGRWARSDGAGIFFDFRENSAGQFLGFLAVPRDRRNEVIVDISVTANSISLLTISGRTFTGTLSADEMSGQYRVNNRPYEFTFVREAPVTEQAED